MIKEKGEKMTQKFSVGGMSCSACSMGIEKAVKKLDGVVGVEVSLLSKSMTVDFDEQKISHQLIIATVEKLGYTASLFGDGKKVDGATILKKRFLISLIILIPLLYLSMGGMFGAPVFVPKINLPVQAGLALAVMIINRKFFISGVRAVINLSPNMDTLVSLGSISAYVYSLVEMILLYLGTSVSHVFFESSAMVLCLVTLGKWLEELTKVKTGKEIERLSKMIPKTVTCLRDGKEIVILTSQLEVGDVIVCKTGDYIAVDGVVVQGHATLDKSAITGESLPEEITIDGLAISGSIVHSGYIHIKAQKVGGETLFAKIVQSVQTAGASKAPIQRLADKISKWFVPIVTLVAIITFTTWIIFSGDLYRSFNFAISVLVVSCPCALGLATPVAVMTATGKGASMGILFKDASALQKTKNINCVLLDKTATLTVGKPRVTDFENLSDLSDEQIKNICYSLESKANHPLANAVKEFCAKGNLLVEDFDYQIGKGLVGYINGEKYSLGNFNVPSDLRDKYLGKSVIVLIKSHTLIAVFAIADVLKTESKQAVEVLNQLGVKTVMLTGDNQSSADYIANQVGIKEYIYGVMPQDKLKTVSQYRQQGYYTAMVGDGINDSPALKGADVGIAMGNGTDIAIDSADVILAGGNLNGVANAIGFSKRANGIIKGNLFWAFLYNVLAIPLSAGALSFFGIVLTPTIASACMCLSSLFVVTNALRINLYKTSHTKRKKGESMQVFIEGMMCEHCEQKVKSAISGVDGVEAVVVCHKRGVAQIYGRPDKNALKTAIEGQGFKVISY